MTKDEITAWALANGWQMIDGAPSLTKPAKPHPAIVRLVLKATVAQVEIKKPAGKWEKVAGAAYAKVTLDEDTGLPAGLGAMGLERTLLPGIAQAAMKDHCHATNPRVATEDDYLKLLDQSY